jgi:hypothetical protein
MAAGANAIEVFGPTKARPPAHHGAGGFFVGSFFESSMLLAETGLITFSRISKYGWLFSVYVDRMTRLLSIL